MTTRTLSMGDEDEVATNKESNTQMKRACDEDKTNISTRKWEQMGKRGREKESPMVDRSLNSKELKLGGYIAWIASIVDATFNFFSTSSWKMCACFRYASPEHISNDDKNRFAFEWNVFFWTSFASKMASILLSFFLSVPLTFFYFFS